MDKFRERATIVDLVQLVLGTIAFLILFTWLVLLGFKLVGANEVGILTKKMLGKKLPQGQIIARYGEVGIQADTLLPGLYYRFPLVWNIRKVPITVIVNDKIGVVNSIDGKPMPPGRLLGDVVECNSFQDAKAFLDHGGIKGPQIDILRPGKYRINTMVFDIEQVPILNVPQEKVGVITAKDGIALPSKFIIAPEPNIDHHHFQDGQAFIAGEGYRGPQLETLQPGRYYINPLLFTVNVYDLAEIPPGYVAVIISSVGEEAEESPAAPPVSTQPHLSEPLHEHQIPLITNKRKRGILKDPVMPGKYNLNPLAYRAEFVPTSAVTIDWASGESATAAETKVASIKSAKETEEVSEFFSFNQLKVTSKDGFNLDVDVRLIIRIPPEDAPYIIARFGSVSNLIDQVAHPLIDSSFRNKAGEEEALVFVQRRQDLQSDAKVRAINEFMQYHVEVQGLLIAYIHTPEELLNTQTAKQIAIQEQAQYDQQAEAQRRLIAVQENTARAEKQRDVIAAKLQIDINGDLASAAIKQAEGTREATKIVAEGTAYQIQKTGEAQASAYEAQTDVIGQSNVAMLKLIDSVASGKIKITPDILVSGEGGQGNLFNAFILSLMQKEGLIKTDNPS